MILIAAKEEIKVPSRQQTVGISKLKCVVRVTGISSERRIHF